MKPLSHQLTDLAERTRQLEESLAAARDSNLQMLAARRTALEASMSHGADRLEDAADEFSDKLKAPWKHARTAVEKAFGAARDDADERRAERNTTKAERRAERAEKDAASAAALAVVVLDQTEYAVAGAALARAEAIAAAEQTAHETASPR